MLSHYTVKCAVVVLKIISKKEYKQGTKGEKDTKGYNARY